MNADGHNGYCVTWLAVLTAAFATVALLVAASIAFQRDDFTVGNGLPGMALIVPATMLTTRWGAQPAHVIDARRLRRVFALCLPLSSARMFYGLFTAA